MSSLDKVLLAAGSPTFNAGYVDPPFAEDLDGIELAALAGPALLRLASDPDNDGDDDSSESGDTDGDSGHQDHALFKAMKKKGMNDKMAAAMCAKKDKAVKATARAADAGLVGAALVALSVTQAERDEAHAAGNSLPDKSYPINNLKQLHSAATLAASHHGDWKAAQSLIRKRAKELGVDVNSLPGFGDSDGDEKVAATMVALSWADANAAENHGTFVGQHTHPVQQMHTHNGDANHGSGQAS